MNWNELLRRKEFWFSYFAFRFPATRIEERSLPVQLRPSAYRDGIDEIVKELTGKALKIPVGRYSLQISFRNCGVHYLDLVCPSRKKLNLSWVDPQFLSDAFRWTEYEAILRFSASHWSGSFKQAYAALLLLNYVAPAAKQEVTKCQSNFRQRLIEAKLFSPKNAAILSKRAFPADFRLVQWNKDSRRGWIATGECYSLRHQENKFEHGTLQRFLHMVGAD